METYKEMIMKEFKQHLSYCNDCHNHSNAQEVLDCFIQGIEEKLPDELHYDEENEVWVIPEKDASSFNEGALCKWLSLGFCNNSQVDFENCSYSGSPSCPRYEAPEVEGGVVGDGGTKEKS